MNELSAFSGYSVNDTDSAKTFYADTLGQNVTEQKEGLKITLKGGGEVFLYEKSDHAPATFTVLNFVVSNIDEAVASLQEKGVALENYDMGPMKADDKGIYRGIASGHGPDIAWFKDSAGNILSVLQSA
ncbi:MAG: Glyoxalase-like domain protein [Parcubacteria group bacterium]|nr:Glyoxalase-like domain protein [Parcubacteria group bacterium]